MNVCRKCGKEIPDGEELCEDCENLELNSGESYLDELMKSMDETGETALEPELAEGEPSLADLVGEMPSMEMEEPIVGEEPMPEDDGAKEAEEPVSGNGEPAGEKSDEWIGEESGMADETVPDGGLPEGDLEGLDKLIGEEPETAEEPLPEGEEPAPRDDGTTGEEDSESGDGEPAGEESDKLIGEEPEAADEPVPDGGLPEGDLEGFDKLIGEEPGAAEEPLPEGEEPAPRDDGTTGEEDSESGDGESAGEESDKLIGEEPEPPLMAAEELADVEEEEEDINDLLDLLSKDYSAEDFDEKPAAEDGSEDGDDISGEPEVAEADMPTVSLFSEDENDTIFADSADGTSVEHVFQDALSAVGYDEDEYLEDEEEEESAFGEGLPDASAPGGAEALAAESVVSTQKVKVPKPKKKDTFWSRLFGNIITDQTAEEEEKEREQEKADAEKRAADKEQQKQQAAASKEEKAAAAQAEKERKAAIKAEKAAAKAAAKEEKKRQKAELEAVEVVGKVNPVGATIVMAFFGIICLAIIIGTRVFSYKSAVNGAESDFENGDYRSAYESLSGVDVSESSEEMAGKIQICMQLQRGLDSYTNYYKMKMYLESLDSLMKGVRSYDANRDKAEEYDIASRYDELWGKITGALYGEFGVSEAQAREINDTVSQEEYTAQLEEIIRQWETKMAQDEK